MKKILLSALVALTASSAMAELNGDGFYRVQNAVTKRYAYLLDNRGSFDAATTSADVNALQLFTGFLRASSDPASVFYLVKANGTNSNLDYNVAGQGTSLYDFLGTYMKLLNTKNYDGIPSYYAYASKSGFTKYLGDLRTDSPDEQGFPSVDAKGDNRLWYIHQVDANASEGYFGITPTVTAGGKYYCPFFAGFPYAAHSAGMKFYSVSKIDTQYGVVVMKELHGVIPAGLPVIAECSNPLASDNRLAVGASGSAADWNGNRLKGVYFDNTTTTHYNRTPFNKTSMRCLSSSGGKLVFAKADYDFIPRNMAYLELSGAEQAIDTYHVMTESEYNDYITGLSTLLSDGYYRMQNAGSKRFAYLADNKGNASSDPDALQLFSGALRASSDPASVFYLTRPSGSSDVRDRDLSAQGTSLHAALGEYVKISPDVAVDGQQAYQAFTQTAAGVKYIGDAVAAGAEQGDASMDATGNNRLWYFNSIAESSDNHFGIAPSLTAGGKYYYPFYADFPFKAHSEGMKFYSVSRIDADFGVMVISELSGVIPAGTPVIVECSNPLASDNRLVVGASGETANVSGNLLSGVWFDNTAAGHQNNVSYDAVSMRSLAVVDGNLVFMPAQTQYVARNQAFVRLAGDAQKAVSQYRVMTAQQYEEYASQITDALPNGYYRLHNASTGRYASLNGSKGNISGNGNIDLSPLQICSELLRAQTDAATVFTLSSGSSSSSAIERDLATQGTSLARVFSSYMKIVPSQVVDGRQAFNAYALRGSEKVFLTDNGSDDTLAAGSAGADWWFDNVDAASDADWFGVVPTVTADGKYYCPFMAGFPYTAASDGMKVYVVSKILPNKSTMIIEEVEGTVPAGTPVIIECAGPLASDNRLAVGETDAEASVKGNRLTGVWFDSASEATPFNQENMRVLASVDGKLRFVKADLDIVPRNQAFMSLSGMLQLGVDDYDVMTQQEFEEGGSVDGVIADDATVDVYGVDGSLVRSGLRKSEVSSLGGGLYILRSASATEKVMVH